MKENDSNRQTPFDPVLSTCRLCHLDCRVWSDDRSCSRAELHTINQRGAARPRGEVRGNKSRMRRRNHDASASGARLADTHPPSSIFCEGVSPDDRRAR